MNEGSEELIWHYTNADAFLNIIANRELWAFDVECMNDHLEKKEFENTLQRCLAVWLFG